ncbi:MAG TPA: hypothetical protein PK308_09110 [Phycisphaerales bacterium]|nr:hypothetical protein [Phycisphaerales bacterium]
MKRLILAALAALTLTASLAYSAPADALRLYAGANGVWLDGPGAGFPADFEASGTAAFSLSPHLTATGGLYYGLSHAYLRGDGGVRVTATDASNPNFDVFLGIDYRGGSVNAVQPSEWAPYAGIGWRPNPARWPALTIGAKSSLGLSSNRTLSTVAIRYQLPVNLFK